MNKSQLIEELKRYKADLDRLRKMASCFYRFSEIIENNKNNIKNILKGLVELVPQAMQFPNICASRVVANDLEFKTMNYKETNWKLTSKIYENQRYIGMLEVVYLEKRPEFCESPFLDNEKTLIGLFTERLGKVIERIHSEKTLQEINEIYREFARLSPVGLFISDKNGTPIYWNEQFPKITGLSISDFKNIDWLSTIHPKDREMIFQKWSESIKHKSEYKQEHRYKKTNGEITLAIVHAVPRTDQNNNFKGHIGTIIDITERGKYEKTINYLANLVETTSDAIISTDLNFKILSWNKGAEKIYGWKADEVIGKRLDKILQTDYINLKENQVVRLFLKNEHWLGNVRQKHKNGNFLDIVASVNLLKDEEGNRIGAVSINRDFTDIKKMEVEFRKSKMLLESFLKTAPDIFVLFDSNLNLLKINPVGLSFFKLETKKNEIIGKNIREIIPSDEEGGGYDKYLEVIKTGNDIFIKDFKLPPKFGNRHISIRVFRIDDGIGVIGTDITDRIKLERELKRKNKLATIGTLAASIAHELRNPLGIINNVLYYLNIKIKTKDEKILENLKILEREIKRSNKIISGLLDFTSSRKLIPEQVDINNLIRETLKINEFPPNVKVELNLDRNIPKLFIDMVKIQQVFQNLIINAIQAIEDEGTLEIKTTLKKDGIDIIFRDTGCGIAKENFSRIFEPLFSTKTYGIGLGLATAKEIIEMHKGTISFKSDINKGTTFIITLPK